MSTLYSMYGKSNGMPVRFDGKLIHPCLLLQPHSPCNLRIELLSFKSDKRREGLRFDSTCCRMEFGEGEEPRSRVFVWADEMPSAFDITITDVEPRAEVFVASIWGKDEIAHYWKGNIGMHITPEQDPPPRSGLVHSSDGPSDPPDFDCLVFKYEIWSDEGIDDEPYDEEWAELERLALEADEPRATTAAVRAYEIALERLQSRQSRRAERPVGNIRARQTQ